MISKAFAKGMMGGLEEEMDELLMFKENWIGLLDLLDMERKMTHFQKKGSGL